MSDYERGLWHGLFVGIAGTSIIWNLVVFLVW